MKTSSSFLYDLQQFDILKLNDLINLIELLDFNKSQSNMILLVYYKIVNNNTMYKIVIAKSSCNIHITKADYHSKLDIDEFIFKETITNQVSILDTNKQEEAIILLKKLFLIPLRKNKLKSIL